MRVQDRVVVITGGASGIGRALALRFAAERAAGIVIGDLNETGAAEVAEMIGARAMAVRTDVSVEQDVRALVETAERFFGPVDLFCSTADAGAGAGKGLDATEADWQRCLGVNLMAHVYAARAVVPRMVARGGGHLLQTCSAAGLLGCPGDAPYTASKTAAVAFADWLAVNYAASGIRVSVLAPRGVRTGRTAREEPDACHLALGAVLTPEYIAQRVIEGLAEERFLILPDPEVAERLRRKVEDAEWWQGGVFRRAEPPLTDEP